MEKLRLTSAPWRSPRSFWVELEDDDDNTLAAIKVVQDGKVCNETFLNQMIEVADEAFEKTGRMSYSSTLCQRDDDQRMQALKDLKFLLFPEKTDICDVSERFKELFKMQERWKFLKGATEPGGVMM
jgi:hypothetical protein